MNPPEYLLPLIAEFESNANYSNALQREKYMRNQFGYYGIKSPERNEISKVFKNEHGIIPASQKVEIVRWCWNAHQREYQYFAMEFLGKSVKTEQKDILPLYEYMIVTKSWWDTIDYIATNLIGPYFTMYPDMISDTTQRWMKSDNIWLQRSCLLFQLKYKSHLDISLLEDFISRLNNSNEFFIQKAIGWLLREYSKTNPDYVINYVNNNQLSSLSQREAIKWMKKREIL